MNAIVDWLKALLAKVLEFWNKYTVKQKTILISVVTAVVLFIVVFAYILTRPEMETLMTASTTAEAGHIVSVLESNNIGYKLSRDAKTIYVDSRDYSNALMVLGNNGIPSLGMTLDSLFDNSFSTTESEKKLKANIYKQDWLRSALIGMDHV